MLRIILILLLVCCPEFEGGKGRNKGKGGGGLSLSDRKQIRDKLKDASEEQIRGKLKDASDEQLAALLELAEGGTGKKGNNKTKGNGTGGIKGDTTQGAQSMGNKTQGLIGSRKLAGDTDDSAIDVSGGSSAVDSELPTKLLSSINLLDDDDKCNEDKGSGKNDSGKKDSGKGKPGKNSSSGLSPIPDLIKNLGGGGGKEKSVFTLTGSGRCEKMKLPGGRKNLKVLLNSTRSCPFLTAFRTAEECQLPLSALCDGRSSCATDECDCGGDVEVFYCSDGIGCIVLDQVCDGIPDCLDSSDECVCSRYLDCETTRGVAACKTIQKDRGGEDEEEGSCPTGTETIATSGLRQCMMELIDRMRLLQRRMEKLDMERVCMRWCPHVAKHCSFIKLNNDFQLDYTCSPNSTIQLSNDVEVCDGVRDCPNGADELYCGNRFSCMDGKGSISRSRVCDGVPDCKDLSDECQSCSSRDTLSDERFLISSSYLSYYMCGLVLVIFGLNLRSFIKHVMKLRCAGFWAHSSVLNTMLCLQLGVYDMLMGVYLFIIVTKHAQYHGKYCMFDTQWRSSTVCTGTGVIFTLSCHGSLLTILVMGLVRCHVCSRLLAHFPPRRVAVGLLLLNLVNITGNCFMVLPVEQLQDVFVSRVFFPDNVMVKMATKTDLVELLAEYFGPRDEFRKFSWEESLAALSNLTSSPSPFATHNKLGFFNQSPLCIHNIFGNEPNASLRVVKMVYTTVVGALILSFSISYLYIVAIQYKSRPATVNPSFRAVKARENSALSKKVTLIVGSQLLAWLPIIIATVLSLTGREISQEFYEVVAIVLIPANAVLNPIFHAPSQKKRKSVISTATASVYMAGPGGVVAALDPTNLARPITPVG
eukprot:sb/3461960/